MLHRYLTPVITAFFLVSSVVGCSESKRPTKQRRTQNKNTETPTSANDKQQIDREINQAETSENDAQASSTAPQPESNPTEAVNQQPEAQVKIASATTSAGPEKTALRQSQISARISSSPKDEHLIQLSSVANLIGSEVIEDHITPWHSGVIGCGGVEIKGASDVDSYDSQDDTNSYAAGRAQVITLNQNALITVRSAANVHGNVLAMGANSDINVLAAATLGSDTNSRIEATHTISAKAAAQIIGKVTEGVPPIKLVSNCDPIGLDAIFSAVGDANQTSEMTKPGRHENPLVVSAAKNVVLTEGRYDYPAITIGGASDLTLKGPGNFIIRITGDVEIKGASSLKLTEDARLSLYVSGKVSVSGAATISNPSVPSHLVIFSNNASSETGVLLTGAGSFSGLVYAPRTNLIYSGASDFYGALRAKNIKTDGAANLWFDTFLATIVFDPE